MTSQLLSQVSYSLVLIYLLYVCFRRLVRATDVAPGTSVLDDPTKWRRGAFRGTGIAVLGLMVAIGAQVIWFPLFWATIGVGLIFVGVLYASFCFAIRSKSTAEKTGEDNRSTSQRQKYKSRADVGVIVLCIGWALSGLAVVI